VARIVLAFLGFFFLSSCSAEAENVVLESNGAVALNALSDTGNAMSEPADDSPPGWSPEQKFSSISLTVGAFLGGVKVLVGLLFAIWTLINQSTSQAAFAAKIITAGMASAAAWLSIIIFSAGTPIDAILLIAVPQSVLAILAIVGVSIFLFFGGAISLYELVGALEGSRPQTLSVGLLSFVATIISHSLLSALITRVSVTGYLVTYILIGGALGIVLAAVSLLLKQDDALQRRRR
jgi:hypothetical protein